MDFELANALGRAVERKDMSTAAHTWRVTMYAQAIGEKVGLAKDDLFSFMLGAVVHDIGKLDIPREILTKPGRLDDVEYEVIKQHTVLGYDRLRRMGVRDPRVLNIVRSHHERLDGSGYPDQLVGDEISREARWFAVIDGVDGGGWVGPTAIKLRFTGRPQRNVKLLFLHHRIASLSALI